jgi:hypothetical protein
VGVTCAGKEGGRETRTAVAVVVAVVVTEATEAEGVYRKNETKPNGIRTLRTASLAQSISFVMDARLDTTTASHVSCAYLAAKFGLSMAFSWVLCVSKCQQGIIRVRVCVRRVPQHMGY